MSSLLDLFLFVSEFVVYKCVSGSRTRGVELRGGVALMTKADITAKLPNLSQFLFILLFVGQATEGK